MALRQPSFLDRRTQAGLFALALLLTVLALIVAPTPVRAATFTVTKTADTNDGVCDADCSLREAILAANAAPDADTITVPAGTYPFTLAGD
jgi:CSLREA domain-containing protein